MDDASSRAAPLVSAPVRSWLAVGVLLLLYALAYLDRQVLTLLVDPIRRDLGVSDFKISLLQGFGFVIFYTLCGLPIGRAVDRLPRRLVIFVGLIFWSCAAAAGGVARTFGQLLLARFGVGAGEASLAPAAYSMLSDLFPRERLAGAMAVFSTGAVIGGALSLALGGWIVGLSLRAHSYVLPLIGVTKPWQIVFLVTGLPGFALAFLVFAIREPLRRGSLQTRVATVRPRSVWVFMRRQWGFYACHFAGFSLLNLLSAGYVAWAPTYLLRTFGWPVAKVGLVLGLISLLAGAAGMLGSGHLVDRLFRKGLTDAHLRYYVWAAPVLGLGGVLATMAPTAGLALLGVAVVSLIIPFIAVAAAALQITTPNEYRGQVSAIFLLIYNVVGYGLGPAVMAGLSDFVLSGPHRLGHAIALVFAGAAPLACLCFAGGLGAMRRAVSAAEAWAPPAC